MFSEQEGYLQPNQATSTHIQYLINLLKQGNQEDRIDAAYALIKMTEPAVVEPLIEAVHDPEIEDETGTLRELIAHNLGCFIDPETVARTIELATDPAEPRFVRLNIMEGWGIYNQPQTLEPLLNFLNGDDPILQRTAYRSLRSFNDEQAFRVVKQYRAKKQGRADLAHEVEPNNETHSFAVSSSHYQFYLGDEKTGGYSGFDQTWTWDEDTLGNALAVAPSFIAVATASYGDVPVDVMIAEHDPGTADFDQWDQIAECSIEIASGRLLIDGCMEYGLESPSLEIKPGQYRVRIYYGGLGSEAFSHDSRDDYYQIVLWPGEQGETKIIKRFRQPDENGRGW